MEKIVVDLLNRPTDGFIKDSGEWISTITKHRNKEVDNSTPRNQLAEATMIKLENRSCLKETNHSC